MRGQIWSIKGFDQPLNGSVRAIPWEVMGTSGEVIREGVVAETPQAIDFL